MADATTPDTNRPEGDTEGEPQAGPAKQARTWLIAALVAGLAAGVGAIAQNAVTSVVEHIKDFVVPPDPNDSVPLTAKASMVDPFDVCDGGGGVVYLKPPTPQAIEQEFNRSWKAKTEAGFESSFNTAHEAKAANYAIINLLIQGKKEKAVTISNVSIKTVKTQPAPKALRLRSEGGCGDANMSRFSVNLDSPQPRLKFKDGRTDEGKQRVSAFPYQVSRSDTETVVIVPVTNQSDYRFKIAVDWESGDQSGTLEVGNGGQRNEPFEIVSGVASKKYSLGQEMVGQSVRLKVSPLKEGTILDPFEYIDNQGSNGR